MTMPDSILAYQDCLELFDRALADQVGIRVRCSSWDEASYLRLRMHKARSLDRRRNKEAYAIGHQMHGGSAYDELLVTIKADGERIFIYLKKRKVEEEAVEGLSEVEDDRATPFAKARPAITVQVNRRV